MDLPTLSELGVERIESHGKPYALLHRETGTWEVFRIDADVALAFGASATREGAERIIRDDASGLSRQRADRFMEWLDWTASEVRPGVRDPLITAGFEPWHMGGGCMAWGRNLDDGSYLLITTQDNAIDGDPDGREWIVGRYDADGGFVLVQEPMGLGDTLLATDRMPSSLDANGEPVDLAFDRIEEAVSGLAERNQAIEACKARMGYENLLKARSADVDGILVEVGLIGPGTFGAEWAVCVHQDCDPDRPDRGTSGVETFATPELAEDAWLSAVGELVVQDRPRGP